jgi:hypothetical protein
MEQASSSLCHGKTQLVTREILRALPVIPSTPTYKPVAHIELIETIEKELNRRNVQIAEGANGLKKEQFAIGKDGYRLFGTLDLTMNGVEGTCAALGFRASNNKTMPIQMVAGLRVFVCDNMSLRGDMIALKRKHTSGLVLRDEVRRAIDKFEDHYFNLKKEVENLKLRGLTTDEAKVMIHNVFMSKDTIPINLYREVSDIYFDKFVNSEEPKFAAFRDRTAWSLHNAFTEVAKSMPLSTRIEATQTIGRYFGLVSQNGLVN